MANNAATVPPAMDALADYLYRRVVLDLRSPYVCLGKLAKISEHFLQLSDADMHDLRDSPTTRENYIVAAKISGLRPNRREVLIRIEEVVAVSRFDDVIVSDEEEDG